MAETKLLPKIGSKIKININKVKDRLPAKLIDQISSNPKAVITGYKMTDGTEYWNYRKISEWRSKLVFSRRN